VHQTEENKNHDQHPGFIQLPAPTVWPMVLGLGITLCMAGFVTNITIAALGLVLALMGSVGWFRNVLPHEMHEASPILESAGVLIAIERKTPVEPQKPEREHIGALSPYNFVTGIEAGLAGGLAMALPALIYSWVRFHSPWYAINVLAAHGIFGWRFASDAYMSNFHPLGLLTAMVIHGMVSVLVGLLYGAMLPIFSRKPLFIAGLIAPLLWAGPAFFILNSFSPNPSGRVEWRWFALSQIAFGLIAGLVVMRRFKMHSAEFQALPLSARAGLHTNYSNHSNDEEER